MRDYVVQSGPLRTFERLFDPRFEKLRQVADYHTIEIIGKPTTQRRVMAEIKRSQAHELRFAAGFFAPFASGHRTILGIRDVAGGKAGKLASKLLKADLAFSHLQYGMAEDDLVVVELKDFLRNLPLLEDFAPPTEGAMFYYLTAMPFDVYEIYWQRAAQPSLKSKDDRFRRDFLGLAHQARISVMQEHDGSFIVVLHPQAGEVGSIEKHIEMAGQRAGMTITFAPGLFG